MSGGLKPGGAGGAPLSNATPQAPGTAASGTSSDASRADHVHTPTTAAQAGAVPTTRTVAGLPLSADISTPSLKTALSLGAVTATGATAAAARAAIGITAQEVPTPLFEAGNGWDIVAPTASMAGTTAFSYRDGTNGLPGLARLQFGSVSNAVGNTVLTGPRIERAVTWDAAKRWRIRVTPVAGSVPSTFGAISSAWLYLRDGSGSIFSVKIVEFNNFGTYSWAGGTKEIRVTRAGLQTYGIVDSSGVWTQAASTSPTALGFTPTHVGLGGIFGGACDNYYDFRDLIIESFV